MFLPHPRVKVSIVGSLRDREVACLASDRQGSNFESFVWRTVSSQSSHHPQKVLLAQFSLYVHKGGLKPDSFHFILKTFLVLTGDTASSDTVNGRFSDWVSYCLFLRFLSLRQYWETILNGQMNVVLNLEFLLSRYCYYSMQCALEPGTSWLTTWLKKSSQ